MIKLLLAISVVCIFCNISYSQNVENKKQEEETICFYPIEIEADYPGGEVAWKRFLVTNFAKLNIENFFPNPKSDSTIKLLIEFIIDTAGNMILKAPEAEKKETKLLFIEIKRIFSLAPRWRPAIKNGKKVFDHRVQTIIIILPHNED